MVARNFFAPPNRHGSYQPKNSDTQSVLSLRRSELWLAEAIHGPLVVDVDFFQ
jgi:hypothetical protein